MFKFWSRLKKNEHFLLQLDGHDFYLCYHLCIIHTHTYTHFIWTPLAYTENCKGQGIRPFDEQIQTWLTLKQKADSLGLRCPQRRGNPKAVSALQHGCWGGEGRIFSVAWTLRTLPGETRTKTEFSLEQQSCAASATDIRGTWLPVKLGLIHRQSHSNMRLAQNEPSSDRLPLYAAPSNFILTTHKPPRESEM